MYFEKKCCVISVSEKPRMNLKRWEISAEDSVCDYSSFKITASLDFITYSIHNAFLCMICCDVWTENAQTNIEYGTTSDQCTCRIGIVGRHSSWDRIFSPQTFKKPSSHTILFPSENQLLLLSYLPLPLHIPYNNKFIYFYIGSP